MLQSGWLVLRFCVVRVCAAPSMLLFPSIHAVQKLGFRRCICTDLHLHDTTITQLQHTMCNIQHATCEWFSQVAETDESPETCFWARQDLQRVTDEERQWRCKLWSTGTPAALLKLMVCLNEQFHLLCASQSRSSTGLDVCPALPQVCPAEKLAPSKPNICCCTLCETSACLRSDSVIVQK